MKCKSPGRLLFLHVGVTAFIISCGAAQAGSSSTDSQRCGAEVAGKCVSITAGHLEPLSDPSTIFVQGIRPTWPSEGFFIGANVEGPTLWKTFYPVVSAKVFFGGSDSDEEVRRYVETSGVFLCGGIGYGLRTWQATTRLQAAIGYWWENLNLTYGPSAVAPEDLGSVDQPNDQVALQLTASLAFPFANRVNALISAEFLARPEEELNGTFENGRWYRIETNGTYGTVSVGFTVALGSGAAGTQ